MNISTRIGRILGVDPKDMVLSDKRHRLRSANLGSTLNHAIYIDAPGVVNAIEVGQGVLADRIATIRSMDTASSGFSNFQSNSTISFSNTVTRDISYLPIRLTTDLMASTDHNIVRGSWESTRIQLRITPPPPVL